MPARRAVPIAKVPLIVALWEYPGCVGHKRLVLEDTPNLAHHAFDNLTCSIRVYPGPDYAACKTAQRGQEPTVALYEKENFGGAVLRLAAGYYPNIYLLHNFQQAVSSVRINPPLPRNSPFPAIPLIVELYEQPNFGPLCLFIIQDCADVACEFGEECDHVVASVRVRRGPKYVAGNEARLFPGVSFHEPHIDLAPGEYPNIEQSHGYRGGFGSVRVR